MRSGPGAERGAEQSPDQVIHVAVRGEDGFPAIILYGYSPTRSGSHAKEFLEGFNGYLDTDVDIRVTNAYE
ncbi:hypothetical protein B5F53_19285 [Blautia sp. An249]|uniref:IS66 family transposase n=1 Tax=Blautia sp. An249 TaxID=1965603 RepID=UPI000B55080D|nr:IS66 family transposase [Blautia sp. An249]OUO73436.1 hypothetical protein B5F53_19285 [Blautia sp. An249]